MPLDILLPSRKRLIDKLGSSKAVVRANLLRILRTVCDVHPNRAVLVERYGIYDIVARLSEEDSAVLVRELARDDDGREVRSGERADGRGERAVLAVLDPGGDEGGDGGEGTEVDVRSKGWESEGGTGLVYWGHSQRKLLQRVLNLLQDT